MQPTYQPADIESHWAEHWEANGYFSPTGSGSPYAIALPPPNVTGTLHMGHGFQVSLMDALIRRARMQGKNTLWQPGTDHAGIATQMVVERQLAAQGQSRHDLGRQTFIDRVWAWRDESGSTITRQMRRLGASLDWERQHFSMDDSITKATYTAFIKLYEDGLVYRGKRLVNWDPTLQTAISDLEVENKTQAGHLWHIRYPLSAGNGHLVVATTRPETLFGDTAVAVHPDDERYQSLIGQTLKLPLTDLEIPIIADEHVDPEFGSGCVKVTPAHDFNDNEIGQRHDLPLRNIMRPDAHLNDNVPVDYRGMERFEARKKVVADLEASGLLETTEPHTLNVPYGDRSGVVIEPLLTDQWFVKADVLAKPAIDALKTERLRFVPENWSKTYLQWLENIQDWCISRQLWWGHRIPVWYDESGQLYVGMNENEVREKHHLSAEVTLTQDNDVFDTWFTAALWPFSSLGWPDNTEALKTFYPTNVLVTGFDIIFFWVARMVMMGIHFLGDVPFREVYITGLIRDAHGQKMSKSKGNILDPIDLIDGIAVEPLIEKRTKSLMQPKLAEKITKQTRKEFPDGIASFGTDALRFTFCALATTGRDINFDMGRIEGYRNFCNKLWNAARFVLMNTEDVEQLTAPQVSDLSLADRWIMSAFENTVEETNKQFERYRFDLVAQALYEFTWNQYCDWYLELAKCILNDPTTTESQRSATQYTLLSILEQLCRLMHPLMPFITESIWQSVRHKLGITTPDSIMCAEYPAFSNARLDSSAETEMAWLQHVINAIRNIRSEMNVSPARKITLLTTAGTAEDRSRLKSCAPYLSNLAKIEEIQHIDNDQIPASANAVVGTLECHIPLAGLIDKSAELARLDKEMQKLKKDCEKFLKKLDNPNYVNKAPAEVVEKERERLQQAEQHLAKLQAHYTRIESL